MSKMYQSLQERLPNWLAALVTVVILVLAILLIYTYSLLNPEGIGYINI
ncbi:hypothetical protein [Shewanella sp. Scap07]|nr:hypothetical protein [Shewanella sp. Scap07]